MYLNVEQCKNKCFKLHEDLYEKYAEYVPSINELPEEIRNLGFQAMCQIACDFESLDDIKIKFNPKFRRWFSEQLINEINHSLVSCLKFRFESNFILVKERISSGILNSQFKKKIALHTVRSYLSTKHAFYLVEVSF